MSLTICKSPNSNPRSIEVALHSWKQVLRLCDRRSRGPVRLCVRAEGLDTGEHVQIALRLPGDSFGFVARIPSRVVACSPPQPRGGTRQLTVELSGLSAHVVDRLRAHAAPHTGLSPQEPVLERAERVAAGTPRPEPIAEGETANWEQLSAQVCSRMKVSELLRNNRQLREQIDSISMHATAAVPSAHR